MRRKLIAGNWKMNKTVSESITLIKELCEKIDKPACDVAICVPYTSLSTAVELCKDSVIGVGAQNMHFCDSGAYTGEISADMLTEIGVSYVIIGHSERRQYFAETDETVNKKIKKSLEKNLIPIVCVGESLEEREKDLTFDVVKTQVVKALADLSADDVLKVVFAYEPIWAIGTGKTATSEQANEVCRYIRDCICELYTKEVAEKVIILYGGSMNAGNADELLKQSDVDGGLIGGASLKADDFNAIINFC